MCTIQVYNESHALEVEKLDRATFDLDEYESFEDYDKDKGWVLLNENKVVGFCLYEIKDSKNWYLSDLAVAPEYSCKGYGTKLLNELFKVADKERIILTTRAYKNQPHLIKLYEKHGFVLCANNVNNFMNKLGSPLMIRSNKS